MSSPPLRIAVGIIRSGSRVVVGKRAADTVLGGLDEFPGGKCRPEESFEAAVVRECFEETGLVVRVLRQREQLRHEYPHGRLEIAFFDCCLTEEAGTGDLRNPFRWVAIDQLDQLNFPEANRSVVGSLRE
jgi:mutator protein MutT